MGIFSDILGEVGKFGGSAVGSLIPIPGISGITSDLGKLGGRALGGLIPYKKGGQVVMTSMGPMMVKPSKGKKAKGKSTAAMKRKMTKVRAAKKK